MSAEGRIIWLTGQPGAGKTTLAKALQAHGVVSEIVDGDDLRALWPETYDEAGRRRNVARAQAIAAHLAHRGSNVAASLVSPYGDQREAFKAVANVVEVYLHSTDARGKEAYAAPGYEPPLAPDLTIDTGSLSVAEAVALIRTAIGHVSAHPAALFIGRWQPLHRGHEWLIRQKLDMGVPVVIGVRDIPPDAGNPLTTTETVEILEAAFSGENVRVIVLPDIESVNWGRGVGWSPIEHVPPAEIGGISATEIRRRIREGDESWREHVPARAQALVAARLAP